MKFFKKSFEKLKNGKLGIILIILLVFVSIFTAVSMFFNSGQNLPNPITEIVFVGEYKIDDSSYVVIDDDKSIDFTGDKISLKGNFYYRSEDGEITNKPLENGSQVYFYLHHIGMEIYINGEKDFSYGYVGDNYNENSCGEVWTRYTFSGDVNDEVEIVLYNPHGFSNANAVDSLLDSLYYYTSSVDDKILLIGNIERIIGAIMIFVAIAMMGVYGFSFLLKVPKNKTIGVLASVLLFGGAFYTFSTNDVYIWLRSISIDNAIYHISLILFMFFACCFNVLLSSKNSRKISFPILILLGIIDFGLFIGCISSKAPLCYFVEPWLLIQAILGVIFIAISFMDIAKNKSNVVWILSSNLLLITFIIDIFGLGFNLWSGFLVSKFVLILLFLVAVIIALRIIPLNFITSLEIKEKNSQLQKYRIQIMLSQIQPHFLYNTLNSIHYLCDKDPKYAKQAIGWFSTYLRKNLDSLKNDKVVSFNDELKHIEIYLKLEKMRFEDSLNIVYDIKTKDFDVPSLTIQTLIENAVNHGVGNKEEGGTVTLKTYEDASFYYVEVVDDGIGFDINAPLDEKRSHIGIQNAKERIHLAGGELIINSTIGVGTQIIIKLPKEDR